MTSRVGRGPGRRDTAGTPSLFSLTSVLQLKSRTVRLLKREDFRICSELGQDIDRKCKVLANSLIDMQQPGMVGLYKYAGLRKKVTRREDFPRS